MFYVLTEHRKLEDSKIEDKQLNQFPLFSLVLILSTKHKT